MAAFRFFIGNTYSVGNNGGRPPFFETPEELEKKIQEYFDEVAKDKKANVTITGLAFYLGFESRQSFYDYKEKAEFSYLLKRAAFAVENCYEENLHGTTPTGSIFALKNMGWKDKTEQEITGNMHLADKPVIFK